MERARSGACLSPLGWDHRFRLRLQPVARPPRLDVPRRPLPSPPPPPLLPPPLPPSAPAPHPPLPPPQPAEHIWTVNESIAELYESDYGKRPRVFRNISPIPTVEKVSRTSLGLPEQGFIAINQGSGMNVDRGLEEALEAISGMPDWRLLLVGSGDAIPALKLKVQDKGWSDKVIFIGRVPYATLLQYTRCADVGLSLDKDTNINYRFSLPNKLFDYLHCDVPVVTSKVREVAKIVEEFGIGLTVNPEDIDALKNSITSVVASRKSYCAAIKKAQKSLTWETEQVPLRAFYAQFL